MLDAVALYNHRLHWTHHHHDLSLPMTTSCWLSETAPETVWLAPFPPKETARTESDNKSMLSSIVLNFCITLSSKNLTDDSTVATLAFSRDSTRCSPFHISVFSDLMSRPIAWFKLLNLALKSLNLPSIWLNLASNPWRISTTVCKLTCSCSLCACARRDIPSAWSMLTAHHPPEKHHYQGFPLLVARQAANSKYRHVNLHS